MHSYVLYIGFLVFELVVAVGVAAFALSILYSSFMGSPYVPTKKKELVDFLKDAGLKKGQLFIELGCGDGRVVRTAVKEYGVKGVGVDINPFLIMWARFLAKKDKMTNIELRTENVFNTPLKKADVVYLFLMPELIKKLFPKLTKELKKGSVVISHGFKVVGWEKKLYKTIEKKPFSTFYYKV
ncbi:MAG: class I SAM-dependent methyltransferase [bacterium]|nr:class I SAM-dependent methyltransferase [bacterium]